MADETKTADSGPILDLQTIAPTRPTVKIDEDLYDLRLLAHDFSASQHACFQHDLDAFDDLWAMPKRTAAEAKRMSKLLDELTGQVVIDLPPSVRKALSDEQKRAIVVAFQYAPALAQALVQQKTEQTKADEQTPTTGT